MKTHRYCLMASILITFALIFTGQALADDIDAKLPDNDNTSSFQVKDSADNVLMKVQSGGKVGIGTASPSYKLHLVGGSFMIHNGTPDLSFEAGLPSTISAWNGIDIKTMATSRLRIESSGNVGIGTTDPKEKLQIGDRLTFNGQVDGSSSWRVISDNAYYDGTVGEDRRIVADYVAAMAFTDSGDILFRTAGTGPAGAILDGSTYSTWLSSTPPLIVKNDGKIGIGTSSPATKLQVNGKLRLSSENSYSSIYNVSSSGYEGLWLRAKSDAYDPGHDGAGINLYANSDPSIPGGIVFFTGGAMRLAVKDNGNVGIGKWQPNSSLQVNGSFAVKRTAVSASASSSGEVIIGVTSIEEPLTVTLSSADCVLGRVIIVKDESGNASDTNYIKVDTESNETIDGESDQKIDDSYGFLKVYSDGADWFIIGRYNVAGAG